MGTSVRAARCDHQHAHGLLATDEENYHSPEQLSNAGAADGDVLTWDDTIEEWGPAAPTGGSGALDDLTDVVITTPADGEVLTYDSGSGDWVNEAPAGRSDGRGGGRGAVGKRLSTIQVPNGTLTNDGGGTVSLDYSKSTHTHAGGGGLVVPDLLNSSKASADTPDDDFPTSSLDGKWTVVDGASGTCTLIAGSGTGTYDLASRTSWIMMQVGTTTGDSVELRQDYTLPDGACLVAPVAPAWDKAAAPANNELFLGIGVNQDDSGPRGHDRIDGAGDG